MTLILRPAPTTIMIGTQGLRGAQGTPGIGFSKYTTKIEMDADGGSPGVAYCDEYPDQFWKWSVSQNQWVPAF